MRILFAAYRRDDFADPEGFIAQLGMVLEGYEQHVIYAVTDPRTGIQRTSKFPPSIAEVVDACDAAAARADTRRRYDEIPTPLPRLPRYRDQSPGRRANLFVPADNMHYERCRALAETADAADWKLDPKGRPGIWIAYGLFYGGKKVVDKWKKPEWKAPTDDDLRARYARQTGEAAE